MTVTHSNASVSFSRLGGDTLQHSLKPSRLEEDVLRMFEEFRDPLLRYILSLGLQMHDGEEIVQEVFLALFQHLQAGKPRTNLKGWIFRVGHNLSLKQRARGGRRGRVQCSEEDAENQLHPQMNPEEQFVESQHRKRVLEEVDRFPEVDRYCLYLRAEGLRYREIAEVLSISLGGVSLALTRSLARLREVTE